MRMFRAEAVDLVPMPVSSATTDQRPRTSNHGPATSARREFTNNPTPTVLSVASGASATGGLSWFSHSGLPPHLARRASRRSE